eukprot:8213137-Pyramimonas_sp.AAC.1
MESNSREMRARGRKEGTAGGTSERRQDLGVRAARGRGRKSTREGPTSSPGRAPGEPERAPRGPS